MLLGLDRVAMAAKSGGVSAKSYVQTDLVCLYDAIENEAFDSPHNPSATVWNSLVGSFVFRFSNGTFADDEFSVSANNNNVIPGFSAAINTGDFTIELVGSSDAYKCLPNVTYGSGYMTAYPQWNASSLFVNSVNNHKLSSNVAPIGADIRQSFAVAVEDGINVDMYIPSKGLSNSFTATESRSESLLGYMFTGARVCRMACYSRKLLASEIAINHQVDVDRYGLT